VGASVISSKTSCPISMTMMTECLECSAPAEPIGGHEAVGVDYDGRDALFWLDMIQCAAGHRYELVDDTRTIYLQRELWG
jgi:hypothetical protein